MSGSVFSDTLQEITNTKLDELSKRRTSFEEAKTAVLTSIRAASDPVQRLTLLSDGCKRCFAIKTDKQGKIIRSGAQPHLEAHLSNIERFVAQARHDPSMSRKTLDDLEASLLRHLEIQSHKYQYATLYGELVTEWLASDQKTKASNGKDGHSDDAEMVDVGSAAKLKSREEWENKVFEPASVDVEVLRRYLDHLFGSSGTAGDETVKQKRLALKQLRESIDTFEAKMSEPRQFNHGNLKWAIDGLMASDLLSNEQREVLKDFRSNGVILSEIADVLNMRIAAIDSWSWGPDSVLAVQRRKISGVFSVHIYEDLLQAIFLQWIGVRWSVFFREVFTAFRRTEAWCSLAKDISLAERSRLEYYLGRVPRRRSLQKARQRIYFSDYFVARLLRRIDTVVEAKDGEVEVDLVANSLADPGETRKLVGGGPPPGAQVQVGLFGSAAKSTPHAFGLFGTRVNDEHQEEDEDENTKTQVAAKQQLLHLLSTEIAINTNLHGELTAFHAVLADTDSSMPHDAVITVLDYLGVSQGWLGFFQKFVKVPLRLDDDPSTPTRIQQRGVPVSHVLSDVFGETLLFCLDYAVNQTAHGQPLWRHGGDTWFWSPHHSTAVTAWKTLESFSSVTGIPMQEHKCGAVRISREKNKNLPLDEALPDGQIRWGFLVLSSLSGQFEVDTKMIDFHIDELRKQLSEKTHSVLALIQTWNVYVGTFLSSNFGKPCNCFGQVHVDAMLETHKRIQRQIFSASGKDGFGAASSIVDYLKTCIGERFGIRDIPDGYFYFPTDLGGLDLHSPFISLLQIRDSVLQSGDSLFEEMAEAERSGYNRLKASFDNNPRGLRRPGFQESLWNPESKHDQETFFSFDEFTRHREDYCIIVDGRGDVHDVYSVFRKLMEEPKETSLDADHMLSGWNALSQADASPGRQIGGNWQQMTPYWRWVATMFGSELAERFGGMSIVDQGLLPMGMVRLFREKRVTWQG